MSLPSLKSKNTKTETKVSDFARSCAVIDRAIRDGVAPCAVTSVYQHGKHLFDYAAGVSGVKSDPNNKSDQNVQILASKDTVFDVGEITQVAVTVPLLMLMVEQGKLDLNHRVSRYLPSFNVHGKAMVTVGHLLSHTAGLPSDVPYYESITREQGSAGFGMLTNRGATDFVVNSILRSSLKNPPETKQSYTEQGFILLGAIVELLTGLSLEKAAQKFLYQPLNLRSASFIDLSMLRRKGLQAIPEVVAASDFCPWRNRLIWGEVFDPNAWAMGGVSGHAGLFTTAQDLQTIAHSIMWSALGKNRTEVPALFDPQVAQSFLAGGQFDIPVTSTYGFDTVSKENGLSEAGLSERSFGLTSSTGSMLWIEPDIERIIVVLTNRIDTNRTSRKLANFRQELCRSFSE